MATRRLAQLESMSVPRRVLRPEERPARGSITGRFTNNQVAAAAAMVQARAFSTTGGA